MIYTLYCITTFLMLINRLRRIYNPKRVELFFKLYICFKKSCKQLLYIHNHSSIEPIKYVTISIKIYLSFCIQNTPDSLHKRPISMYIYIKILT